MRRLGPFLLIAWLVSPAAADGRPALSVDAPATLRCPGAEPALAALVRQLAPRSVVPSEQPLGRFHLHLRPHGARGISMTLRSEQTLLVDRTIDVAPHECDGLADTVALIAAAWVRDADPEPPAVSADVSDASIIQPWDDAEPAPPQPAQPAQPARSTGRPPNAAQSVRKPRKPVEKPAAAPPAAETRKPALEPARKRTPPPERDPEREAPQPSTPPDAEATEPAAREPVARARVSLEGALGTAVSLDGAATPALLGRAGIEVARKRLRLGLRGHAESARTLGGGDVLSVRHSQLELDGGAAFAEDRMVHGALLLGAGFDLIAAEAKGHARRGAQRSFAPIGTVALRGGLRAHDALDVFASAELVVALRRERFAADDQPLARTARTRARLLLGVSWHVF